jgi:putative transposase
MRRTIDTDPHAPWIFVLDQLHIHKSESLVRLVAERCTLGIDLVQAGRSPYAVAIGTKEHTTFLRLISARISIHYSRP